MLDLRDIKKDYLVNGEPYPALKGVTTSFSDKGFVAILGPSGCGKTTLLNIIGGLDHYTSGDLVIDGRSTKDFKDREWDAYRNERVGFVFQSYNLIPHMNVLHNVEISLMLNGVSKKERERRASEALEAVGLLDERKKRPNQLSGGQMQRVALARALVNNPKIVLADEPTGALDSVTSVQVMEILAKVAEDRLVIMVTHNKELAFKYATRVIEMQDGVILSDNAPESVSSLEPTEKEKNKKTSMSFWTALKSSLSNLNTKKGRTSLIAVASSIGIIGVALVLALSNGFTGYVDSVEASLASSVPLTITKNLYAMAFEEEKPAAYPDVDEVLVSDTSAQTYVAHTNYYDQNYVDNILMPLVDDGLARSVMVNRRGLSFNIVTEKGIGEENPRYMMVNQEQSAGMTGALVQGATSLPATVFHELYGEEDGLSEMYDVIYGRYPQKANELVLIVDKYNQVEKSTLEALGFFAPDEEAESFSFEEIVGTNGKKGKTYKAIPNSEFYGDENSYLFNAYTDISVNLLTMSATGTVGKKEITIYQKPSSSDSEKLGGLFSDEAKGMELEVVGVIRPSEDSYMSFMPSSIGYLSSLKDIFVADAANNCEDIQKAATSNWLLSTSKDPETGKDGLDRLNDALKLMKPDNGTNVNASSLTAALEKMAEAVTYLPFAVDKPIENSVPVYSSQGFMRNAIAVGADFREDLVSNLVGDLQYAETDEEMTAAATKLLANFLKSGFYTGEVADGEFSLVDMIAYSESYSLITSILVFPVSLTAKTDIKARLDKYNSEQETPKTAIKYSDIMSSFTDSIGLVISLISTVLIIFAAISLVVSSIMTAVITYVSVIERTKEIGILRSCGARKKDVGRLFQAESCIIGAAAGTIGILFTLLVSIPINVIIDNLYPNQGLSSICSLNWLSALILIAVAIVLAFLSGLIPSRMAAKKDPVIALRTE